MNRNKENYLEKIPIRVKEYKWTEDEDGIITLQIENRGIFNRACQKIIKKPSVSYIHLDKIGSLIWRLINGEMNVVELGKSVYEEFGDDVNPLYERLIKYLKILESYNFIKWKEY